MATKGVETINDIHSTVVHSTSTVILHKSQKRAALYSSLCGCWLPSSDLHPPLGPPQ